jgi:hypothetical protein
MKNFLITATALGTAIAGIILYSRRKATKNPNAKTLSNTARDTFKQLEEQTQLAPIYTME